MKDEGLMEPVTRIDSDKWTCPPGDRPPVAPETRFHGEQANGSLNAAARGVSWWASEGLQCGHSMFPNIPLCMFHPFHVEHLQPPGELGDTEVNSTVHVFKGHEVLDETETMDE